MSGDQAAPEHREPGGSFHREPGGTCPQGTRLGRHIGNQVGYAHTDEVERAQSANKEIVTVTG